MDLEITPFLDGNPFITYPELRKIWPESLARLAEEGLSELLGQPEGVEAGEVFIIHSGAQLVGISGYFPYEIDKSVNGNELDRISKAGLAWHGILPQFRGRGFSSSIIGQVALVVSLRYKNCKELLEFLPLNDYGSTIRPHFEKLGFTPRDIHHLDWIDCPMQEYAASIQALKPAPPRKRRFGLF